MQIWAIIGKKKTIGRNEMVIEGKDFYFAVGRNKVEEGGKNLETYLANAEEGCFVFDTSDVPNETFIECVFNAPLLDFSLASGKMKTVDGEMDLNPDLVDRNTMVSFDLWVETMRDMMPEIKTGKVIDHQVVWDVK